MKNTNRSKVEEERSQFHLNKINLNNLGKNIHFTPIEQKASSCP